MFSLNLNCTINLLTINPRKKESVSVLSISRLFKPKLTFSKYQHCPNLFANDNGEKELEVKTTFCYTFPSCDLQCLLPDDPRNLWASTGIRLQSQANVTNY